MASNEYKPVTRRRLPHVHPADATLFVTFRLVGSIPQELVRRYKATHSWFERESFRIQRATQDRDSAQMRELLDRLECSEREWFVKFEDVLDRKRHGPHWLKDDVVASIVAKQLMEDDDSAYRLDAYCTMSNHVHVVLAPFLSESSLTEGRDTLGHVVFLTEHPDLAKIMKRIKGRTARECNLALGRSGQFWEHESFDHVVRRGRLVKSVRYVLNNPVKAGLVAKWTDWPWSCCR